MSNPGKFKTALLAVLILLAAVAALPAQDVQEKNKTIRVSGEATMTVDSDMAVLTLAVVQQAKTTVLVQQSAAQAADRVISALKALGIDQGKIRTSGFSINPVRDDRQGKQNEIIGYKASNYITVTIEDTSLVAQAVDAAIQAGANEVQSMQYRKRDEASLRMEILGKAAENARAKALALAEALGLKLGKALAVEEQGFYMQTPDTRMYSAKGLGGAELANSFSPGSIDIKATVAVVFEFR